MDALQQEFLTFITAERALSENTRVAYEKDLDQFLAFCHRKGIEFHRASLPQLREFMASLRKLGNSERTLARKQSTLRQFFQFLIREERVKEDPSELLQVRVKSKRLPKWLSEVEMNRLIESADGHTEESTRDRALLELWYATGGRVSEIANLPIAAVDLADGFVRIRGKGGSERMVPLSRDAQLWCLKYRQIRLEWVRRHNFKDPKSFFLSQRGRGFSRQGVAQLLKRSAKRAGISKRVWPHLIRHTFATHLLSGGADLRVVQELLGHRSISTTEVYTHLDIENLKDMQIKFHPRR